MIIIKGREKKEQRKIQGNDQRNGKVKNEVKASNYSHSRPLCERRSKRIKSKENRGNEEEKEN